MTDSLRLTLPISGSVVNILSWFRQEGLTKQTQLGERFRLFNAKTSWYTNGSQNKATVLEKTQGKNPAVKNILDCTQKGNTQENARGERRRNTLTKTFWQQKEGKRKYKCTRGRGDNETHVRHRCNPKV